MITEFLKVIFTSKHSRIDDRIAFAELHPVTWKGKVEVHMTKLEDGNPSPVNAPWPSGLIGPMVAS